MKTKWLERNALNERDIAGAASIMEACRAMDHPTFPIQNLRALTGIFEHGFDGEPPELLVSLDDAGAATGVAEVWLPRRDNTHIVFANVLVDPALRRNGIGRLLFEEVADYARRDGRTVIVTDSADRPEYEAFATAMGQEQVYEEVFRRQILATVDRPRLDREYADAQSQAEDYELVRLAGAVPEELIEQVVTLTSAINDAPHTTEIAMEDEVFTRERLRAFEAAHDARGVRLYRVVARHKPTGELGGHTVVGVNGDQPWFANQYDTSVVRAHRGHRLGLLLKIDMLRWLTAEEPQLRELGTANAGSNEHMIRVNEILGYEVHDRILAWQRDL